MANAEIKLTLTGDRQVASALDSLSKGASAVLGSFKKLTDSIFSLNGLLAAAASAFAVGKLIDAANAQEDAIANLNAALAQTGNFTEQTSEEFQQLATQIQNTSKIGDEAALQLSALALSFGLNVEQAKLATQAAVNFSAATGKSAVEAVQNLAGSLSGNIGLLGKTIPAVKNLTKEQLINGEAIQLVAKLYDGFAKKTLVTFSAATTQTSNAFGDLLEELGALITKNPVIIATLNVAKGIFVDLAEIVKNNRSEIIKFINKGLLFLRDAFVSAIRFIGIFSEAISGITSIISPVIKIFVNFADVALQSIAFIIKGWKELLRVFDPLTGILKTLGREFLKFADLASRSVGFVTEKLGSLAGFVGADKLSQSLKNTGGSFRELAASFEDGSENIQNSTFNIANGVAVMSDTTQDASNVFTTFANKIDQDLTKSIDDVTKGQENYTKALVDTQKQGNKTTQSLRKNNKELQDDSIELIKFQNELREQIQGLGKLSVSDPFVSIAQGLSKIEEKFEQIRPKLTKKQIARFKADLEIASKVQIVGIVAGFAKLVTEGAEGAKKLLIGGATLLLDKLLPDLGQAVGPLLEAFAQGPDAVRKMVREFVQALPQLILAIVQGAVAFIEELILQLPNLINGIIVLLPDIINALVLATPTIVSAFITSFIQGTPQIIATLVEQAPKIALAIISGLIPGFGGLTDGLTNAGQSIFKSLKDGGSGVLGALKDGGGFLVQQLTNLGQGLYKLLVGAGEGVFNFLKDGGKKIFDFVKDAGKEFFNLLLSLPEKIFEGLKNLLSKLNPFGSQGFLSDIPILGDVLGGIGGVIQEVPIVGDLLGGFFARGGVVPEGFPEDTFPARLTSGEFIIDNSLTPKLERFLNQESNQQLVSNQDNEILLRILDFVQRPVEVRTSVQFNQDTLADIILNLQRTNRRLA